MKQMTAEQLSIANGEALEQAANILTDNRPSYFLNKAQGISLWAHITITENNLKAYIQHSQMLSNVIDNTIRIADESTDKTAIDYLKAAVAEISDMYEGVHTKRFGGTDVEEPVSDEEDVSQ